MELVIALVIILASVYPYILLIRLMKLSCKALKKYINS